MSESDAKWDYIKKTAGEVEESEQIRLNELKRGALTKKCKNSIQHINQLTDELYFVSAALSIESDGYYKKFIAFVGHEDLYQGLSKFTTFIPVYIQNAILKVRLQKTKR
jgi:hypothetical protein